jgi:Tfp pilus assembly protein PilE
MIHFSTKQGASPRGFTLLVALIFVAVILSVGLTLTDVAYKQVILASTARQSEYAFYNADSAIECALELDQQYDAFDFHTELIGVFASPSPCEGQTFNITASGDMGNPTVTRTNTFSLLCNPAGTGPLAQVTIIKGQPGSNPSTIFYSDGFNDCNASNPQRVERGLKSQY